MEKETRVLVAEKGNDYGTSCADYLKKFGFEVELIEKDGAQVIESIKRQTPAVIVMDAFMPRIDAIGVMEAIRKMNLRQKPAVILMASVDSPKFEEELLCAGADHYFVKPFDFSDMAEKIAKIIGMSYIKTFDFTNGPHNTDERGLEIKISDIMRQIGVPAHIKGYAYLRESIMLTVKEPEMMHAVTKALYPAVAKLNNTTSSRVERAIRHAIEVAWDRGDVDILTSYFGYTIQSSRGKPTNSEFIAMISDKLRLLLKAAG